MNLRNQPVFAPPTAGFTSSPGILRLWKREELERGDGYRVLKEDTFVGLLRV